MGKGWEAPCSDYHYMHKGGVEVGAEFALAGTCQADVMRVEGKWVGGEWVGGGWRMADQHGSF